MAVGDKSVQIVVDVMERQWIQKALENQAAMLRRSLAKENPGSDIYQLRQKEIAAVSTLAARVAA